MPRVVLEYTTKNAVGEHRSGKGIPIQYFTFRKHERADLKKLPGLEIAPIATVLWSARVL